MDINVFAKFDEIPSLPVHDIKEKSKCRRKTDGCENSIPPPTPTQACGNTVSDLPNLLQNSAGQASFLDLLTQGQVKQLIMIPYTVLTESIFFVWNWIFSMFLVWFPSKTFTLKWF